MSSWYLLHGSNQKNVSSFIIRLQLSTDITYSFQSPTGSSLTKSRRVAVRRRSRTARSHFRRSRRSRRSWESRKKKKRRRPASRTVSRTVSRTARFFPTVPADRTSAAASCWSAPCRPAMPTVPRATRRPRNDTRRRPTVPWTTWRTSNPPQRLLYGTTTARRQRRVRQPHRLPGIQLNPIEA